MEEISSAARDRPRDLIAANVEAAVIVVSYNGRHWLDDCLRTLLASGDGPITTHVVVVDNASSDGSLDFVRERFPQVTAIPAGANLGFAAGNNLGWREVSERFPATKYVALINQDTEVQAGWLQAAIHVLETHPEAGAVQPKIRLHPDTNRLNTVGNRSHYLGFGFPAGMGEIDSGQYDRVEPINYASGAAVVVRTDLLKQVGLFHPALFMYLEDAELSWKIRQLGYEILRAPESCVYHKYAARRDLKYYYFLERNRWWLVLVFYRWPTLLLLAPAFLFMEFGQNLFALQNGCLREKWRSYLYFWQWTNLQVLWRERREVQRRRTIGDRAFLARFCGDLRTPHLDSAVIKYVASPLFSLYWQLARRVILW